MGCPNYGPIFRCMQRTYFANSDAPTFCVLTLGHDGEHFYRSAVAAAQADTAARMARNSIPQSPGSLFKGERCTCGKPMGPEAGATSHVCTTKEEPKMKIRCNHYVNGDPNMRCGREHGHGGGHRGIIWSEPRPYMTNFGKRCGAIYDTFDDKTSLMCNLQFGHVGEHGAVVPRRDDRCSNSLNGQRCRLITNHTFACKFEPHDSEDGIPSADEVQKSDTTKKGHIFGRCQYINPHTDTTYQWQCERDKGHEGPHGALDKPEAKFIIESFHDGKYMFGSIMSEELIKSLLSATGWPSDRNQRPKLHKLVEVDYDVETTTKIVIKDKK